MPYLKSSAHAEESMQRSRLRSKKSINDLPVVLKSGRRIRDWEEYQLFMTENAQHVVVIAGGETYEEEGDGRRTLEALRDKYAKEFVSFGLASLAFAASSGLFQDETAFVFSPRPLNEPLSEPTQKYKVEDLEEADALIGKLVGSAQSSVRGSMKPEYNYTGSFDGSKSPAPFVIPSKINRIPCSLSSARILFESYVLWGLPVVVEKCNVVKDPSKWTAKRMLTHIFPGQSQCDGVLKGIEGNQCLASAITSSQSNAVRENYELPGVLRDDPRGHAPRDTEIFYFWTKSHSRKANRNWSCFNAHHTCVSGSSKWRFCPPATYGIQTRAPWMPAGCVEATLSAGDTIFWSPGWAYDTYIVDVEDGAAVGFEQFFRYPHSVQWLRSDGNLIAQLPSHANCEDRWAVAVDDAEEDAIEGDRSDFLPSGRIYNNLGNVQGIALGSSTVISGESHTLSMPDEKEEVSNGSDIILCVAVCCLLLVLVAFVAYARFPGGRSSKKRA